jgi:hypothetical protein
MFGASDLVSDDKVLISCLPVPPAQRPSAHAADASLADSDDEFFIPRLPPVLLWFRVIV